MKINKFWGDLTHTVVLMSSELRVTSRRSSGYQTLEPSLVAVDKNVEQKTSTKKTDAWFKSGVPSTSEVLSEKLH